MGNVPKLRFPEFKGEWDREYGEKIFSPISNKKHSSDLPLLAITQEHGAIPRDFIDFNISVTAKSVETYKVVEVGDFIISLRTFQGGIEYSNYKGICSPAYIILRPHVKIDEIFFKYYFKTERYIKSLNEKLEGIRDGKMISFKYFSEATLTYPTLPEQTRIASFLTVIDKKIAQLKQKKTLLEQYKKGVMQKLFSQELRFKDEYGKEFPEWEEKKLGVISEIKTGNKDTQNREENGSFPFFVRSDTVERINSYSYEGEAILTSGDGVGVGKNFHYINGKFDFHQRVYSIRKFCNGINGKYIFFYFSTFFFDRVKRVSAKNSVDSVRMEMIAEMPIGLPCIAEQTKIANFLSSIDEKINRTETQIQQIQEYKKGLLQNMFC
jgi:type I restriction enzyme S subunit